MVKASTIWSCPRCGAVVQHVDRLRDADGHLAKHCGCRTSVTIGMTPEQLADHKRQVRTNLKRKYRREAGAPLRVDIAAIAAAKREAIAMKKADLAAIEKPHDAHVKRYARLIQARANYAIRWAKDPQKERDRVSAMKQALPDHYVVHNLKASGMPTEAITPHLISLKRESMEYKRISRTLKTAIKNNWKEENETITKHP